MAQSVTFGLIYDFRNRASACPFIQCLRIGRRTSRPPHRRWRGSCHWRNRPPLGEPDQPTCQRTGCVALGGLTSGHRAIVQLAAVSRLRLDLCSSRPRCTI